MNTYEIKEEYNSIIKILNEESYETDENGEVTVDNTETIQELLSEIVDKRDDKADSIAYLIKSYKDSENSLKAEIDRLNARKKMFMRNQESLKTLLGFLLNGEKLKTERFTFSYRTSQSVNIIDADLIPAEFLIVKETFTPNKKAIKEALANFDEVAGAEIVVSRTLGVK